MHQQYKAALSALLSLKAGWGGAWCKLRGLQSFNLPLTATEGLRISCHVKFEGGVVLQCGFHCGLQTAYLVAATKGLWCPLSSWGVFPTVHLSFQDDVVMGTMTVRENLQFSAALRLPSSITIKEKEERVTQIINELGLSKVADAKVSSENTFLRNHTASGNWTTCLWAVWCV